MNETEIFPHVEEKKCSRCGKEFKSFTRFLRHKMIHIRNDKLLKCVLCAKKFKRNDRLKQHYVIHTGKKPYQCDVCKKSFFCKYTLLHHKKLHETPISSSIVQYICVKCGIYFKDGSALRSHKKTHFANTAAYNCDKCNKSFFHLSRLKQHYIMHTGEKPFECEYCHKKFSNKSHLVRHSKIHETAVSSVISPLVKCPECEKEFKTRSGLRRHLKAHFEDVRIHKCELCDKKFTVKSALKHHHLTHTGEKPIKCETSEKCFNKKSTLTTHSRLHEIRDPVVKKVVQLKCSECDKEFKSVCGLTKHKNIHFGIRKVFACDICDKKYSQISHLKQHFFTHTLERPFVCEICAKSFYTKSHLIKHLKIHYPDIFPSATHKCSQCGKVSKSVATAWNHKRIHFKNLKDLKCDICDMVFSEIPTLKQHFMTHTTKKPFECEICGLWHHQKGDHLKHKMFHSTDSGNKTFKCQTCGRCFNIKGNLIRHTKLHTRKKSPSVSMQKCSKCGKEFQSNSEFRRLKKNHITDEGKIHECGVCGEKFSEIAVFKQHHQLHIRENPSEYENCKSIKESALIEHNTIQEIDISSPDEYKNGLNGENSTKVLLQCENTKEFAVKRPKFMNLIKLTGVSTLKQYYLFHYKEKKS